MSRFRRRLPATLAILFLSIALVSSNHVSVVQVPAVFASTRNIELVGNSQAWNHTTNPNPAIRVGQGDTIIMSLQKDDLAPHQFFVDVDRNGPPPNCQPDKCSNLLPTTYQFTVDFAPGSYVYYCTFHTFFMRGSFIVEGFTISSNPAYLTVIQGSSKASTITVTSVDNFVGVVNLAATVSPGGPSASLTPTSVTLSANGTASSTLTVSTIGSTLTGNYVVSVTGTSGSSFSARDVPTGVVAPDFSISANPATNVVLLGSSGTSTITLRSLDNFAGTVNLSMSPTLGIAATLTPNSVTLSAGETATSTLDVTVSSSATLGTYTINVTGDSGSLSHSVSLSITIRSSSGASNVLIPILMGAVVGAIVIAGAVLYFIRRGGSKR